MTLHCAEIKGYNNIALLQDAFAGEAKYVPHCTCRDAGATVQRSRKVATISHEYVVAWTTAQERQGTTLRRDAGSTVQRSRKVATNRHEYVTAWTPAQERQGRYRIAQGCRIYCAEIEKGRY